MALKRKLSQSCQEQFSSFALRVAGRQALQSSVNNALHRKIGAKKQIAFIWKPLRAACGSLLVLHSDLSEGHPLFSELHFTTLHYISLHFTTLHYIAYIALHCMLYYYITRQRCTQRALLLHNIQSWFL